ncbi:hypothetical protein A6E15_05195 [Natrinema saccharevitans]|uniref:Glycosyltransferase RgtA/B/C/D-like domain-containing protein n=1 Tax=Natrinema saccharevitans TaxID=301967 RepID=A0A1S8AU50_9EURY|nr:DUF6541 family protein [Natrinema saccharevitans]OLZ40418.1 hypothetical protein A6E15_05195 [Natrinema saccharevitans]
MSSHSAVDDDPIRKLVLAIGFLAVSASALVAHANPATGYEISIYTMTPRAVWAGLLVALSVSLAVAFVPFSRERRPRGDRVTALLLGGLVMVVFVALPIVRGYRFYGHYDALTHLGWARGISEGTYLPFELFYPGIHTVTTLVHSTVGVPLSRSMLFVVVLAAVLFCLFVPLCLRTILPDGRAATIGGFSAFLLLPITTISMYLSPHSMSQAVLFSGVLLYLFTKYLRTAHDGVTFSAVGVAFALTSLGVVLYHPQLAAHLFVALLGICVVQYLSRVANSGGRIADQTPVYGQALFLGAAFLLWSSNYGFFGGTIRYFLGSTVDFLFGRGGAVGDTVGTQGSSLSAIGGSLLGIFLKLFSAQLAFSLLTGGLVLAALVVRRSEWLDEVRPETTYFTVAVIALGPVFVAYSVAAGSKMYFRVFGLMMVFVTILGAIALHGLSRRLSNWTADSNASVSGSPVFAFGFAILLVVSLLAVFPSPYAYKASPHVTDAAMDGYRTAFDERNEEIEFLGLRNGPDRYDDAVNGNQDRSDAHRDVSAAELEAGVAGQYEADRYLSLTRADYEREVGAYRELRYTASGLDGIGREPGVNRIQSNGEFELYYVPGNETAT